jgi:hypothetical protein
LEDTSVDGNIIIRWIYRKWDADMDKNDLTQDRDRQPDFVKGVIYVRAPQIVGNFLD